MNLTMIAACRPRRPSAFDPLSTSPYILLDPRRADSRPLKTGGSAAGFMDTAATQENPGSASDAIQATGANQPMFLAHTAGANYLYCPGVAGNGASVPDSAAVDINGSIDIRVKVQFAGYPPANCFLVDKGNSSYGFFHTGVNGVLRFGKNGVWGYSATALFAASFDGWLRVVFDTVGQTVTFSTSTDGTTWVQLGTQFTGVVDNPDFANTSPVLIGDLVRGAIHRVRIFASANGTDERLDINFAAAPHRAASFVCATGQTVTVQATGNNPAVVVGYPMLRYDGVDDFLSGTFASAINGGRMFAVFTLLGNGGTGFARFLSTFGPGETVDFNNPTSSIWLNRNSGGSDTQSSVTHNGVNYLAQPNGWLGTLTRRLSEIYISSSSQASRLNNADEVTSSGDFSGLASTSFNLAGPAGQYAAIDLEALYLLPASASAEQVASMRSFLNARHGLGLTLP